MLWIRKGFGFAGPAEKEHAAGFPRPDFLLGDKGYDSDDNRGSLLIQGVRPVIPSMRSRKVEIPHDKALYRQRNRIERMIGKLKQSRRVATRYDKTMMSFRGFIRLAAIKYGYQPSSTPPRLLISIFLLIELLLFRCSIAVRRTVQL